VGLERGECSLSGQRILRKWVPEFGAECMVVVFPRFWVRGHTSGARAGACRGFELEYGL
jgi:hypothetical protein